MFTYAEYLISLQQLDKQAKAEVDAAVEESKASPEPSPEDLWPDIYYKGTEPPFMRGREREEVRCVHIQGRRIDVLGKPGSLLLTSNITVHLS